MQPRLEKQPEIFLRLKCGGSRSPGHYLPGAAIPRVGFRPSIPRKTASVGRFLMVYRESGFFPCDRLRKRD